MQIKKLLIFFLTFNTLMFLGVYTFLSPPNGELNLGWLIFSIIFTFGGFIASAFLFTVCDQIRIYIKYNKLIFSVFILLFLNLITFSFDGSYWTPDFILKIYNQNFDEGFYFLLIIHGSMALSLLIVNMIDSPSPRHS